MSKLPEGRLPPFGKEVSNGTDVPTYKRLKFVNPPLLKTGDVLEINWDVQLDEDAFTPVNGVRTWVFTPEDTNAVGKLTLEDLEAAQKLIQDAFRKQEDLFYCDLITGTNEQAPAKSALYDENYRSAVLDKDGKFVRKID